MKKFRFSKQNFEDIELEKTDLIVSNFSLSFCDIDKFKELWNKIQNSIKTNRIFCRKFFLEFNDEWNDSRTRKTFFTREQVEELFGNFEIIIFKEIEKDGMTRRGKRKALAFI